MMDLAFYKKTLGAAVANNYAYATCRLPKKQTIIALTKLDIADEDVRKAIKKIKFPKGTPVFHISAITGEGIEDIKEA